MKKIAPLEISDQSIMDKEEFDKKVKPGINWEDFSDEGDNLMYGIDDFATLYNQYLGE